MSELPTASHAHGLAIALPVEAHKFSDTEFRCVNALDLYNCLLIGREFRKWIDSKLKENLLIEGRDFVFSPKKVLAKSAGRPKRQDLQIMFKVTVALEIVAFTANAQSPGLRAYLLPFVDSLENVRSTVMPIPAAQPPKSATLAAHDKPEPAQRFESVEVIQGEIGGEKCLVVDGRALWQRLGVSRDFTTWLKKRIQDYDFIAGSDFDIFHRSVEKSQTGKGLVGVAAKLGRPTEEYLLTIEMAKELAMVERNPQGRQARRYFIDCERQLAKFTLADAVAAAQSQQAHLVQRQVDTAEDSLIMPDVKILCALTKARTSRTWQLAMRHYGKNLLLCRDEEASEAVATALQERLSRQLMREVKKFDGEFFEEPIYSEVMSMIKQWTPTED